MGDDMKAKPVLLDELEKLYQGIPDESVNLTFQDLASVNLSDQKIKSPTISPSSRSLAKIPSLDFAKGLQACSVHHQKHDFEQADFCDSPWGHFSHASGGARSPRCVAGDHGDGLGMNSMSCDEMSVVALGRGGGGGRRRRQGIPHSKICAICSTYVYVFRTRCLVCGRVYCRRCVQIGMGDMIEGRKCIECLGLRFSQRYIERAGKAWGCSWRYSRTLKEVELNCAEKGPRRSAKNYGHHSGISTFSRSTPTTPRRNHTNHAAIASNNEHSSHSFVMSSPFSSFSPHHNLPF